MRQGNKKIIVILGPTSSGKTKLAVELANKFNGEIISADSRQVYRGMDIGTGKDLAEYKAGKKIIPYHLIDIANPKARFNVAKYQKLAFKAIDGILRRGKLPILAGGSGLYLQAVVDNFQLSNSKPDLDLRKKLEKLGVSRLGAEIKKLSPKMAAKINDSDSKNKRRLIRYLEILLSDKNFKSGKAEEKYEFLIIGPACSREALKKRIYKRLIYRLEKEKMVDEVKRLRGRGLSFKKLEAFGLEYKFIALYLQGELRYDETAEKLNIAINQFAGRQLSWFRRWQRQGRKINWVKNTGQAVKVVSGFLE
ncbi:MAG: tRNA (adenosine(37)-N6)-dimethylallyltransferase MiaA [Patescibacteria group bacterium]|jgi:tRNA dimethylallyltransferase